MGKISNYQEFAILKPNEIFSSLETSTKGLTTKEAELRLKKHGVNELSEDKVSWPFILIRQFKSFFTYILLTASVLSFALGEKIDAIMILSFVIISVSLGFIQDYKSVRALHFLKKYINIRAKVVRNNKEILIDSRELVPGDIVKLTTGDIVAADLRIIKENDLLLDEQVLTGESFPVKKNSTNLRAQKIEIYEAINIAFSGTKIVGGSGEGVVFATGGNSTMGEIAKLSSNGHKKISEFEKGIVGLSRFTFLIIGITMLIIFLVNLLIGRHSNNFFEFLLFFVALAVSVIPEALPAVVSMSLSGGAIKLAKKKVVVRRLSAIEDLGSIEILCTDKTGTLTQNKLTISEVTAEDPRLCLAYATIACSFDGDCKQRESNNSFDMAIQEKINSKDKKMIKNANRINELSFTPERRRNSVLAEIDGKKVLIVRGAPEEVVVLSELGVKKQKDILNWTQKEGVAGKRTLAVAYKTVNFSKNEYSEKEESQLNFLGVISFADPLKPSTKRAVKDAEHLGVQIKVITGDSLEVAAAVGFETGLIVGNNDVTTGKELDDMSEEEFAIAIEEKIIFARVSPQQKYRIIDGLGKKFRVGYLGEGINDVPALEAANVSMVVESASDIARQSADIILLQQSLEVIIDSIKEGRQIFSNIVKYVKATLASNFGNFYAIAISTFLISYLPMLPLQILLLNLLSDFPMMSIAADSVDIKELKRPKSYNIKDIVMICTLLGLVSTIFDFVFFAIFSRFTPEILHTSWFIGSILTELALIFSIRTKLPFFKSKHISPYISWLSLFAAVVTVLVPFTQIGQTFFGFVRPEYSHLMIIFLIVLIYFVVTEIVKLIFYHFFNNNEGKLKYQRIN